MKIGRMKETLPQRVQAEIKKYIFQSYITPEFLSSIEVDEKVAGEFAETLAIRVILTLMGRIVNTEYKDSKIINKTEEIDYYHRPKTWWDGLKFEIISSKWFGWMFPDCAITDWIDYEDLVKSHNFITNQKQEI